MIQPSRAAHKFGDTSAAIDWLRSIYILIPDDLRPEEEDIPEFAAFFGTYLTSSFDIVENPGTRGSGAAFGLLVCRCELCLRIINASHLRPKKLYARDKRRANLLMKECLLRFATENHMKIDDQTAVQIVEDKRTRRAVAYITYGHWLILRLAGESDGPAILALWRIIAWNPLGGQRRGFTLQLNDFKLAEKVLLRAFHQVK